MQSKIISHNFTGKSLTVVLLVKGRVDSKIVEQTHPNWAKVEKLYRAGKYNEMIPLLDVTQAINASFKGKFIVKNGRVYRGDEEVKGYLFDRIIFFVRNNLPYQRLLKFAENLYANPSERSREELFKFLDSKNSQDERRGGFPITDDGCFLAYKGVQDDFYSITSGSAKPVKGKVKDGKIYNGVGEKIEIARNAVDDNSARGCSYGLHVGSWEYANNFKSGGRMLIVKVNPRDVVSVPNDESCQKVRTCAYEVIAEEGRKLDEAKDGNFDLSAKAKAQKRNKFGRFA